MQKSETFYTKCSGQWHLRNRLYLIWVFQDKHISHNRTRTIARDASQHVWMQILNGQPVFIIVFYCNFKSIVHRFRQNELILFVGRDTIAISSPGGAYNTIQNNTKYVFGRIWPATKSRQKYSKKDNAKSYTLVEYKNDLRWRLNFLGDEMVLMTVRWQRVSSSRRCNWERPATMFTGNIA